jgi:hypothetical protein
MKFKINICVLFITHIKINIYLTIIYAIMGNLFSYDDYNNNHIKSNLSSDEIIKLKKDFEIFANSKNWYDVIPIAGKKFNFYYLEKNKSWIFCEELPPKKYLDKYDIKNIYNVIFGPFLNYCGFKKIIKNNDVSFDKWIKKNYSEFAKIKFENLYDNDEIIRHIFENENRKYIKSLIDAVNNNNNSFYRLKKIIF